MTVGLVSEVELEGGRGEAVVVTVTVTVTKPVSGEPVVPIVAVPFQVPGIPATSDVSR